MARRRRFRKPLLPGLWTVLAAFALMGSIGGLFWLLGNGHAAHPRSTAACGGEGEVRGMTKSNGE
jgi:H+/Cl- antiporter ClcA